MTKIENFSKRLDFHGKRLASFLERPGALYHPQKTDFDFRPGGSGTDPYWVKKTRYTLTKKP